MLLLVLCEGHSNRIMNGCMSDRVAAPKQTRIGMKFNVPGWRNKMAKLHKERKAKSDFFQLFSHAPVGSAWLVQGSPWYLYVRSCLVTKCVLTCRKVSFSFWLYDIFMLGTVCAHLQPQPEQRHYLRVWWKSRWAIACFRKQILSYETSLPLSTLLLLTSFLFLTSRKDLNKVPDPSSDRSMVSLPWTKISLLAFLRLQCLTA